MNKIHELLDLAIPLAGASHANVVSYDVVVPLRYSECLATLEDGRQVRLRHPRQLVGWSGSNGRKSLFFKHGDRGIEIETGAKRSRIRSIHACRLTVSKSPVTGATRQSKVIARDGGIVYTNQLGRTRLPAATGQPTPVRRPAARIDEVATGVPA